MGSLKCNVSVLSFSDLFVHLFSTEKSGVLTITQGTMKKSFYINSKGVSLLTTTGQARSLGEMLIRTRKITRSQLDYLLDENSMTGSRLAEVVQRYGLLTAQDVEIAKRDHVEEELHELFTWKDAVCEFVESPAPLTIENFYGGVVVDKAATALMLESARRSDELAKIMFDLGDERLIPVITKPWSGQSVEDVPIDLLHSVYRAINGESTVFEVVRRSLYPRLEALRAIQALVVHGVVTLVGAGQATEANLKGTHPTHPPAASAAARGAPAPQGSKFHPKTILLLGEMDRFKTPLMTTLEQSGYAVRAPAADLAATDFSIQERISVAIVDVGSRGLKSYPLTDIPWEFPTPRVIAVAQDGSLQAKRKALEEGATVYLLIPFTKNHLLDLLSTVLVSDDDLYLPFYSSDIS